MKIEMIAVSELIPYENNPRNNQNAVESVANSIKQFGFKVPIVITSDNVIVAGHTRLLASQKLGLEKVPCIVADDLSEQQIKAFRLADNKVSEFAEWDFSKLEVELAELDLDMSEFGFEVKTMNPDDFGEDFELPSEDKSEIVQMTFTLHENQAELIRGALDLVDEFSETYGNENKNGNKLFEIVKQWTENQNGF